MRMRLALFATVVSGVIAANIATLRAVAQLAWATPTSSHLVVVPLVSTALILGNWHDIGMSSRYDWVGAVVLIAGVVASLAGRGPGFATGPGTSLTVSVGAVVVAVIGAFLWSFGRESFRKALFPLLFLTFAIPVPDALLHLTTQALKKGSAEAVSALFRLTGTPFYRDRFVFSLPGFTIEIADECSGIRSSIALLLTTLIAAHLFLERTWAKAILVIASLPIAIFKNAVRIVTLSLLARHVDSGFLTGQLHHEGGFVFFLMALGIVFPLLSYLRNFDAPPRELAS